MPSIATSNQSPFACVVREADVSFYQRELLVPLQLSTGCIHEVTEAQVQVVVDLRNGQSGRGRGSVYLSELWAWPTAEFTRDQRSAALREFTTAIAVGLPRCVLEALHPLDFGVRFHHWVCHELPAQFAIPALARIMCGSPFDAAIHDAVGAATGRSALAFYDEPFSLPLADKHFLGRNATAAIRRLIQSPLQTLPAWWVVNKDDPLPAALAQPVQSYGYQRFKLKITGRNAADDARRTADVHRAAVALGVAKPQLVVDSNESNSDERSVLEYLVELRSIDRQAWEALLYLEQPTDRDITRQAVNWREVARQKPVMLDEGLTDLSLLPIALDQGWSGLALKTCKSHSLMLVAAAWAHERGMLLSMQDLTNPGVALIHSAVVAAHLPTINGLEANSPQFTPKANAEFLPRLACLFEPRDGCHRLPSKQLIGLGSCW